MSEMKVRESPVDPAVVVVNDVNGFREGSELLLAAVAAHRYFEDRAEAKKKAAEDARADEAAKVMCAGYFNSIPHLDPDWDEITDGERKRWRDSAKAILAAIGDGLV